ncbi:hypothetical protein LWI28_025914 [Acer negundo]|uniref:Uncharacterized protein n=1 Tax=Acer negundo TaxID=4023 RepID=A0AAD5IC07_ACENE|nr:hypothetical protein LWI28_025914 [Acer negundo]
MARRTPMPWHGLKIPNLATHLKGLTFVSNTCYEYKNLWHVLCAMTPFVSWSIKNGCLMLDRWVLFYQGELRDRMRSWLHQHMEKKFGGEVEIEGPYCFERAVVMRHNLRRRLYTATYVATDSYMIFDLVVAISRAATCWWRHLDLVSSIIVTVAKTMTLKERHLDLVSPSEVAVGKPATTKSIDI